MRTNVSAFCTATLALLLVGSAAAQPEPPPPPEAAPEGKQPPPGAQEPAAPDEEGGAGHPGGAGAGQAPPPAKPTQPEPARPPEAAGAAPTPKAKLASELPPVPPPPPTIFPSQLADGGSPQPLVGLHRGRLFLRDAEDIIRLYPGVSLRTDFNSTIVPPLEDPCFTDAAGTEICTAGVPAAAGGSYLHPGLTLRRVRLELSGELLRRVAFTAGLELGGQRIGEIETLTRDTLRFAPATALSGGIRPAEVSVSYRFRRWLSFTVGQTSAPFSMSNRTREALTPFMERPLGIRGFAVPENKELGLTIWGELDRRVFAYELGVYSGDGPMRPAVDARPDFMGRIYARPLALAGEGSFFDLAQIGISARHGERDQAFVAYDYPAIASNQGYIMWLPGYLDSYDRLTHIIPSGAQNAIGGELRLPFDLPGGRALEIRGEAYYVHNNTREAVDGFQLTNTERFGRVEGVGWYGLLSLWLFGDPFVSGEPGVHRPPTLELGEPETAERGVELLAMISGIAANYSGATREGSLPDANTPESNIAIYQWGAGVQYWYSRMLRIGLNWLMYWAPDAGDVRRNQAYFPSNLWSDSSTVVDFDASEVFHELSARAAVTF